MKEIMKALIKNKKIETINIDIACNPEYIATSNVFVYQSPNKEISFYILNKNPINFFFYKLTDSHSRITDFEYKIATSLNNKETWEWHSPTAGITLQKNNLLQHHGLFNLTYYIAEDLENTNFYVKISNLQNIERLSKKQNNCLERF